jgi:succinate dehydrogenase / fumarate reductase flavoprotein subunit
MFSIGESNFSDHGARLGASALMQGLADGFCIALTIGDYLAPDIKTGKISTDLPEFEEAGEKTKAY